MDEGNLWFCERSCERIYFEMEHLFAATSVDGNREVAALANCAESGSRRGARFDPDPQGCMLYIPDVRCLPVCP